MPGEQLPRKGTNQFMRMGHTAGAYGNDPSTDAKGGLTKSPRELKA
jgi:hypothetical protein